MVTLYRMIPNLEAIENASECVSAYNDRLFITMWNPACEKKFSIKAEQAVGKHLLQLFPFIANDYRVVALQSSHNTKQTYFFRNMVYQFIRPAMLYTQYIRPIKNATETISIVKDHEEEENLSVADFKHFFLQ